MPPPRASSADNAATPQPPAQIAAAIEEFLSYHAEAAILEDGKVLFDLRSARHSLSTEHNRCTLHLWSDERNLVRRILSATLRNDVLRLSTQRLGQSQSKLLELVSSRDRRTPTTRDAARTRYLRLLERVLAREFPDCKPDAFRTAMDLERSFGPAYARGSLLRGNHAWAVIAVNEAESSVTIDGILTLGILWLHHCREHSDGRRLYQGLKLIVPRGSATLTLSRLAWLNQDAAQWQLYELDQATEELVARDIGDHGNLRTRLVHHPDEAAAAERFASAIEQIAALVPEADRPRIDHHLRSPAELIFLLHGLEFARASINLSPNSFAHTLEITAGAGASQLPLTPATRAKIAANIAELFARRRAFESTADFAKRGQSPARRIGATSTRPAHSRLQLPVDRNSSRRNHTLNPNQDPLFRAAPERWLESVLRRDLAPLTRSLASGQHSAASGPRATLPNSTDLANSAALASSSSSSSGADDPDTRGNRADPLPLNDDRVSDPSAAHAPRVIPRLDPQHVYAQVPAIAGASDRGLLDLLGVTADGRLAVIELKADDDLHLALQGLDYWIRVRHHHLQTNPQTNDAAPTGLASATGEFQRHGYFRGVELSPLPPRLYLVAPALHIHPATEIILRFLSPRVEWSLLALDERWRSRVRVLWRKQGGRAS